MKKFNSNKFDKNAKVAAKRSIVMWINRKKASRNLLKRVIWLIHCFELSKSRVSRLSLIHKEFDSIKGFIWGVIRLILSATRKSQSTQCFYYQLIKSRRWMQTFIKSDAIKLIAFLTLFDARLSTILFFSGLKMQKLNFMLKKELMDPLKARKILKHPNCFLTSSSTWTFIICW
jgi:hypothetical protein